MNESDAYALEEALQLKEKHGGEVIALLRRPRARSQTIREALAKGADRAIHIEGDDLTSLDALGVASRLAAAISTKSPTSFSPACNPTISATARPASSWPNCSASRTPPSSFTSKKTTAINVKRELEDGWFQNIELPLPAVLTIQSGSNKLRYATLMGIKKAKTKEVRKVSAADLPQAAAATVTLESITCRRSRNPPRSSPAPPKKPPQRWLKNSSSRCASYERRLRSSRAQWRCISRMSGKPSPPASSSQPHPASRSRPQLSGDKLEALSGELANKKLAKVFRIEHALLKHYTSDGYVSALEQFIRKLDPSYIVFPHTYQVRDFAPASPPASARC